MLENASFVHVFGCMCMLELTITGWWIIVAHSSVFLTGLSCIVSQLLVFLPFFIGIPTSFFKFKIFTYILLVIIPMYVCTYKYMYMFMCKYIRMYVPIHAIMYVYICTYICTYIYLYYVIMQVSCSVNIIKYNITVIDQYSPANLIVPANMSSVEISEFPDNDTSIVANREYTITVSTISDQGTSYTIDPVVVSKLKKCITKYVHMIIRAYLTCMFR